MRVCAVTAQMSSFEISHSKTAIHPDEDGRGGEEGGGGKVRRAHGPLDGLRARCISRPRAARTVCCVGDRADNTSEEEGRKGACACIAAPPSVTFGVGLHALPRVIAVIRFSARKSALLQTREALVQLALLEFASAFRIGHSKRMATPNAHAKVHREDTLASLRALCNVVCSNTAERPAESTTRYISFFFTVCLCRMRTIHPPKRRRLLDHPSSRREACGCFASSLVAGSPGRFPVSETAEGISRSREIDRVDHVPLIPEYAALKRSCRAYLRCSRGGIGRPTAVGESVIRHRAREPVLTASSNSALEYFSPESADFCARRKDGLEKARSRTREFPFRR